jgi:hypothetical protein
VAQIKQYQQDYARRKTLRDSLKSGIAAIRRGLTQNNDNVPSNAQIPPNEAHNQ